MADKLMSLRGYATSRGMALSTLQHHIKTGKLKTIEGKIDPEYADICLRERINAAQSARASGQKRKAAPQDDAGSPPEGFTLPDDVTDIGDVRRLVPRNMFEAQYFNSLEELQRRRTENEAKEGSLVSAEDVTRVQFEFARTLRDTILAIPARVADHLAATADPAEVDRILTHELRLALESTAKLAESAMDDSYGLQPELEEEPT
ncbi:hypothetical protein ACTSKR_11360 [Chitinibacteraceae bacterium HSL-7]